MRAGFELSVEWVVAPALLLMLDPIFKEWRNDIIMLQAQLRPNQVQPVNVNPCVAAKSAVPSVGGAWSSHGTVILRLGIRSMLDLAVWITIAGFALLCVATFVEYVLFAKRRKPSWETATPESPIRVGGVATSKGVVQPDPVPPPVHPPGIVVEPTRPIVPVDPPPPIDPLISTPPLPNPTYVLEGHYFKITGLQHNY